MTVPVKTPANLFWDLLNHDLEIEKRSKDLSNIGNSPYYEHEKMEAINKLRSICNYLEKSNDLINNRYSWDTTLVQMQFNTTKKMEGVVKKHNLGGIG